IRTGMPVRPAIATMRNTPYATPDAESPFRIVVLGGSQGARIFSDVIPAAVRLLPDALRKRLEITQQCRPEELDRTHALYAEAGAHVQLRAFFDNVPALMANAHLLITRSGASTVAEATVIGRPSLLVPYPFAADDHQTANAQAVDAAGGAWMIRQPQFTAADLAARIAQFAAAPYGLAGAATAAAAFAVPDAATRLADVVTALIRGENGARVTSKTAAPPPSISTHTMNRGII
ncbi:MAG: UDP-N-acetylglucosamine--N-acetylmuramyl-(pentapeptide) pyrophosphoryl-undecaprenol N-acetylglucosamine transferase, partial [Rhodospirillaceae bacterium]|nr:UDP-N-acetylglucosamine--N-acetylmuramyl-(pentapeptide) pyrophosphoryl-undecaprenol N-acetylglucosamine transferase [Rhodospirillaceae bacterium]